MKHHSSVILWLAVFTAIVVSVPVRADVFSDSDSLLPPLQEWTGKSEQLMVAADNPWVTPAERTGLRATPAYDETVSWLQKLVAAAPELQMVSIGKSLQGRDLWMVIACADQVLMQLISTPPENPC